MWRSLTAEGRWRLGPVHEHGWLRHSGNPEVLLGLVSCSFKQFGSVTGSRVSMAIAATTASTEALTVTVVAAAATLVGLLQRKNKACQYFQSANSNILLESKPPESHCKCKQCQAKLIFIPEGHSAMMWATSRRTKVNLLKNT